MSEEIKKTEETKKIKETDLQEKGLDEVTGGGVGDPITYVGVGLGKRPTPGSN